MIHLQSGGMINKPITSILHSTHHTPCMQDKSGWNSAQQGSWNTMTKSDGASRDRTKTMSSLGAPQDKLGQWPRGQGSRKCVQQPPKNISHAFLDFEKKITKTYTVLKLNLTSKVWLYKWTIPLAFGSDSGHDQGAGYWTTELNHHQRSWQLVSKEWRLKLRWTHSDMAFQKICKNAFFCLNFKLFMHGHHVIGGTVLSMR